MRSSWKYLRHGNKNKNLLTYIAFPFMLWNVFLTRRNISLDLCYQQRVVSVQMTLAWDQKWPSHFRTGLEHSHADLVCIPAPFKIYVFIDVFTV